MTDGTMMVSYCSSCGTPVGPAHRFCANCGAPVPPLPPPYPYYIPAPPHKNYTPLIVVVVVLLVVCAVVVPAVLYVLVSGLLTGPTTPGPPMAIGVAVTLSADGSSWVLAFTSVPTAISVATTTLVLIPASLTGAFDSTLYDLEGSGMGGVVYIPVSPGSPYCTAGDRILIAAGEGTDQYAPATEFRVIDASGVLASGTLQ